MYKILQLVLGTCLEGLETRINGSTLYIFSTVPKYEFCYIPEQALINVSLQYGNTTLNLTNYNFNGTRSASNDLQFELPTPVDDGTSAYLIITYYNTQKLKFQIQIFKASVKGDMELGFVVIGIYAAVCTLTALLFMFG